MKISSAVFLRTINNPNRREVIAMRRGLNAYVGNTEVNTVDAANALLRFGATATLDEVDQMAGEADGKLAQGDGSGTLIGEVANQTYLASTDTDNKAASSGGLSGLLAFIQSLLTTLSSGTCPIPIPITPAPATK